MSLKRAIARIDRHRYVYLTEISEPEVNILRVIVEAGRVLEEARGADGLIGAPIVADELTAAYEITFADYLGYAVRNELYTVQDSEEEFTGRVFAVYTRSKFLDFMAAGTIASEEYPGPHVHYAIHALDHILDVAALTEPQIKIIRPGRTAE